MDQNHRVFHLHQRAQLQVEQVRWENSCCWLNMKVMKHKFNEWSGIGYMLNFLFYHKASHKLTIPKLIFDMIPFDLKIHNFAWKQRGEGSDASIHYERSITYGVRKKNWYKCKRTAHNEGFWIMGSSNMHEKVHTWYNRMKKTRRSLKFKRNLSC